MSLLFSCTVSKNHYKYAISEVYGKRNMLTKSDSLYIQKKKMESKSFREKCEREKLNCFFDPVYREAQFPGGEHQLRKIFYTHFKMQKDFRPSRNTIVLTIDRKGKLQNYQTLNTQNINIKNELDNIKEVLISKKWQPAKIYGLPVVSQMKIDLTIE